MYKQFILVIYAILHLQQCLANSTFCNKREFGYGSFVCVCRLESCHMMQPVKVQPRGKYLLYTTDKTTHRFALQIGDFQPHLSNDDNPNTITIDRKAKLQQQIFGFGGAFTVSSVITINSLKNEELRNKLIDSYFDKNGLEYNLGRVPIGCTDFSTHFYTYDDTKEPDVRLEHFALKEIDHEKIKLIKQVESITGGELKSFATSWYSPKWMLENFSIKKEYYQTWADYHIKFLESYDKQNVSFWGITTGNEPLAPYVVVVNKQYLWQSMSCEDMNYWVINHFSPTIRNSSFSNLKIMLFDEGVSLLPYFQCINPLEISKHVDLYAIHPYITFLAPTYLLELLHRNFPELPLIVTEACRLIYGIPGVKQGDWRIAEVYAHTMIEYLDRHVIGWVDWNLSVDTQGGPNYYGNYFDAPIMINATAQEFYKQPMYYILGHFSKFVTRGSHKINHHTRSKDVQVIAFKRPDDGIVVVLLNRLNVSQSIVINDSESGQISLEVEPHSIKSLVYW